VKIDLIVRSPHINGRTLAGFEQLIGLRVDDRVVWNVPMDSPVEVSYQAGGGPAQVRVTLFADQVAVIDKDDLDVDQGTGPYPDAEAVIDYMVEHHINDEPVAIIEDSWRTWVRKTITALKEMSP
jgi:hypothetical protein